MIGTCLHGVHNFYKMINYNVKVRVLCCLSWCSK